MIKCVPGSKPTLKSNISTDCVALCFFFAGMYLKSTAV